MVCATWNAKTHAKKVCQNICQIECPRCQDVSLWSSSWFAMVVVIRSKVIVFFRFSAALSRQTSTNIGPHGRGINYAGGWLPSKIRMDDGQWHKYELIKGTLDLAIPMAQPWPIELNALHVWIRGFPWQIVELPGSAWVCLAFRYFFKCFCFAGTWVTHILFGDTVLRQTRNLWLFL